MMQLLSVTIGIFLGSTLAQPGPMGGWGSPQSQSMWRPPMGPSPPMGQGWGQPSPPWGPPPPMGQGWGQPPPPWGPPPPMGPPPPCPSCPTVPRPPPMNPNCPNTNTEANKKLVLDFYQEAFGDKNSANLEKYLNPNFIEHNFSEPDGIEAMRSLIDVRMAGAPKEKVDIKMVLADKDLVVLRVRLNFLGSVFATGDYFRIGCDGLIAEHWDSMQNVTAVPIPTVSAHPFW